MIVDYKECGLSFKDTTTAINEIRDSEDLPLFRIGAVKGAVLRMPRRIVRLTRKPQGNYDANSNWARARFNFALQVLVRLRKVETAELRKILSLAVNDPILDQFNIQKLTPIQPEAIHWWDEVHRDCFVGDLGARVK